MNTVEDSLKKISMLDSPKSIQTTEIPVKTIKCNSNFSAEQIWAYINESIGKRKFPICVKLANITSVFKKGERTSKNNNRPVSVFPEFSKISEKPLQN